MSRLNNIKPKKAAKFLLKHGFEFIGRRGSHMTFCKEEDQKMRFVQVIDNNKTIYWKNVKIMINKSGISEKKWIQEFG